MSWERATDLNEIYVTFSQKNAFLLRIRYRINITIVEAYLRYIAIYIKGSQKQRAMNKSIAPTLASLPPHLHLRLLEYVSLDDFETYALAIPQVQEQAAEIFRLHRLYRAEYTNVKVPCWDPEEWLLNVSRRPRFTLYPKRVEISQNCNWPQRARAVGLKKSWNEKFSLATIANASGHISYEKIQDYICWTLCSSY